jgi:glutathione peroxidase
MSLLHLQDQTCIAMIKPNHLPVVISKKIILMRRFFIFVPVGLLVIPLFFIVVNAKSQQMSIRQYVMRWVYPVLTSLSGKKAKRLAHEPVNAAADFYKLEAQKNDGEKFSFSALKGKPVLIVNTASNCGYTPQYADLQKLYAKYKDQLHILAFPSNDFRNQESGTDAAIAKFCKANYGVEFTLMKKIVVKKGNGQHPVYQWLTDPKQNGWNEQAPSWNFSKYVINKEGRLTNYFDPAVSPMSDDVIKALFK